MHEVQSSGSAEAVHGCQPLNDCKCNRGGEFTPFLMVGILLVWESGRHAAFCLSDRAGRYIVPVLGSINRHLCVLPQGQIAEHYTLCDMPLLAVS